MGDLEGNCWRGARIQRDGAAEHIWKTGEKIKKAEVKILEKLSHEIPKRVHSISNHSKNPESKRKDFYIHTWPILNQAV